MLVAGGSTLAVRSARHAWALARPERVHVSAESRIQAAADLERIEDVVLRTSDGLSLQGWFAPGRRRASVVFVHGLGANRVQLLPEARLMARHGYGVLLYDSRGSGESDGDVVTWGDKEQLDAKAAIDFLSSRPDVDPDRIAVYGFSLGASTAAMAISRDSRPRAAILCATWSSFDDEIRDKFSKWGPLSWGPALLAMRFAGIHANNIRPIDYLRAFAPRPLLMITGTLDEDTPVSVENRVFQAAGDPKELWVVTGAHHGEYLRVAGANYESKVLSFLDRALEGGAKGE